ncbi:hypothetical protein QNA08_15910 [Chelatococcus sp. SYSU_G07232]|uniref:Uncharacterized protein n=1 Tax=Chelatococcus albus TaxID=3047466 RepID=A0ABT7AK01_9HYPH|nr:hypothetical protein [Chelatococcus sp. SYSU_G07232]MDJ1159710.1 hypothetical protein [Chelatococcus sp. SYSU_G07232]
MAREDERAKEALQRVERDSETLASSSIARAAERARNHFAAEDAVGAAEGGGTDRIELWGRRIGRALGLLIVLYLLVSLFGQFGH